jgi:hypothetical protein
MIPAVLWFAVGFSVCHIAVNFGRKRAATLSESKSQPLDDLIDSANARTLASLKPEVKP